MGQVAMALFGVDTGIFVIFVILLFTLVLFVFEPIPIDITAISMLVVLVILEPWTRVTPELAISGFANPATITVLAMFVLSAGIQRTGAISELADRVVAFTGDNERRQLAATMGIAGPLAGVVNNTPVVAVLIPMVTDIAERTNTSPSKLFIPLSYAAMLGGMLTLIGTSPNILASDISDRLIDRPYSMFEFTQLGALVLLTGVIYMLTIGHRLIPERIPPGRAVGERYDLAEYVFEVEIEEDSRFVGRTVGAMLERLNRDIDVLHVLRHGKLIHRNTSDLEIRAEDRALFRTDRDTLIAVAEEPGLHLVGEILQPTDSGELRLVEIVVIPESAMASEELTVDEFRQRYNSTILGIRRGAELLEQRLSKVTLRGGDTLLVQTTTDALDYLQSEPSFVVTGEVERPEYRRERVPIAGGIVILVVAVAAVEIIPISVAAIGGMAGMVITGCVKPEEVYDAIDWNVIFLLAGVIPLGISLERTGAAELVAMNVAIVADYVPLLVFLVIFYMMTAMVTEIVTNLASVALMIPIAVDVANAVGSEPFSFILLVTFAASDSLMTPVGYQTNLMVYSRGEYEFTDFLRVGIPLQLLLAIVTSLGIAVFWGI